MHSTTYRTRLAKLLPMLLILVLALIPSYPLYSFLYGLFGGWDVNTLAVFDRAFAITSALQLLAAIVAFVGVLSALLSLQLERARELGLMRAVGLTVQQLRALVLLETGLMGSIAGLLAVPTGTALAIILIFIINRRSFGWTMSLHADPVVFIQALLLAVVAALLAGLYPAIRLGRMAAAEALRGD